MERFEYPSAFILVPSLVAAILGSILSQQTQQTETKKVEVPTKHLFICAALIFLSALAFT